MKTTMQVNGDPVTAEVDPHTLLSDYLRDHLGLTGTHVGCDTGQCGACTVHLDGRAIKACCLLVGQAEGAEVVTIEGLDDGSGELHPMQAAFREHHGLQCGFCTPGMVMAAVDVVRNQPDASDDVIREELEGNICRCTGYENIVRAVKAGAAGMRG